MPSFISPQNPEQSRGSREIKLRMIQGREALSKSDSAPEKDVWNANTTMLHPNGGEMSPMRVYKEELAKTPSASPCRRPQAEGAAYPADPCRCLHQASGRARATENRPSHPGSAPARRGRRTFDFPGVLRSHSCEPHLKRDNKARGGKLMKIMLGGHSCCLDRQAKATSTCERRA